ncbi:MAG: fibronectin type III domain-containing protein, partial [Thermoplasmata archaeon]
MDKSLTSNERKSPCGHGLTDGLRNSANRIQRRTNEKQTTKWVAIFVLGLLVLSAFAILSLQNVGGGEIKLEASSRFLVPSPPRNLRATPGDECVTLTWETPTDDGGFPITSYRIYWCTATSSIYTITVSNILEYTITHLTNGQTYYFVVSAINDMGESATSNAASATPCTVPSAPLNLQATAGNGKVTLNWQPPRSNGGSPITGYKVYWGIGTGTYIYSVTVGNVTRHNVTGLTNGQKYFFAVSAINGAGEGAKSNEVSATPYTVPSAPQNLRVTAGTGEVSLTWEIPTSDGGLPITNYKVYWGTVSGNYI